MNPVDRIVESHSSRGASLDEQVGQAIRRWRWTRLACGVTRFVAFASTVYHFTGDMPRTSFLAAIFLLLSAELLMRKLRNKNRPLVDQLLEDPRFAQDCDDRTALFHCLLEINDSQAAEVFMTLSFAMVAVAMLSSVAATCVVANGLGWVMLTMMIRQYSTIGRRR